MDLKKYGLEWSELKFVGLVDESLGAQRHSPGGHGHPSRLLKMLGKLVQVPERWRLKKGKV